MPDNLTAAINQLASRMGQLSPPRHLLDFSEQVKAAITRLSSPFDQLVLDDRLTTFVQQLKEQRSKIETASQRLHQAHSRVSAALPKRGWYLSGKEPCALSLDLASLIEADNWEAVDGRIMEHLPKYDAERLEAWLAEQGVPEYCSNRLHLLREHHAEGRHEEATYIGVPLIDEIAIHLYDGKSFTTKAGNRRTPDQSKPELAFRTSGGPDLVEYCKDFIETFGSLQANIDPEKLADENYWNRHAIVHGEMRRPMGMKDSAKCLMAINFLFFARKEDETGDTATSDDARLA